MLRSGRKNEFSLGRSPLRRRAELWPEQLRHLAFVREAVQPSLAEDLFTVDRHLEHPVAAGLQLNATEHGRPAIQDFLRQAHGLVEIVSRDAELDRDLRFACHLWALTCSYTPYISLRGAIPP